jgi:hypothetical protein
MIENIKKYWLWLFVIIFIIYLTIRNNSNITDLKEKGKTTIGYIYDVRSVGSKGTIRCFYRFKINNYNYYEGFYDDDNLKKYDSLQIIYLPDNPKKNQAKKFVDDY